MRIYNLLIFDIDGTLLDFRKAERIGIRKTLMDFSLPNDDKVLDDFIAINKLYWTLYEEGKITQEEMKIARHIKFFRNHGIKVDFVDFNECFENNLGNSRCLIPDAIDVIEYLKLKKYYMILVSNGFFTTQMNRLRNAGLDNYFEQIFVSDRIGYAKPKIEFFEAIFNRLDWEVKKENTLLIGDSLTADIAGGKTFGIDTCWTNFDALTCGEGIEPVYEIRSLRDLMKIL